MKAHISWKLICNYHLWELGWFQSFNTDWLLTKKISMMLNTWHTVLNKAGMIPAILELYISWKKTGIKPKSKAKICEYRIWNFTLHLLSVFNPHRACLECHSDLGIRIMKLESFFKLVLFLHGPSLLRSSLS